jgi:pimeloyl-ACP methyl ester carboxylesterase
MKLTLRILKTAALGLALVVSLQAAAALPQGAAPNIVIVPGSFVDGSGWRVVYDILSQKGYHVTIAQQPHTSLDDDVAATRELLDQQVGPVVLVGHSSGGAVASIAGARQKVRALVYVAALVPSEGESLAQLVGSMPAPSSSVKPTQDGHLFVDRARFGFDVGGDLPNNRTDFMAASQVPATTATFQTQIWAAAWHDKPSFGIVATDDRALNPDLQRWMYRRAGAAITEVKASHLVYVSQPDQVAKVIEQATLARK